MRSHRRFQIVCRLALALLALAGESAVVGVTASVDEVGAAAHVEQSGVALHHAHNEATCLVCRVLSLHGRTPLRAAQPATIAAAPSAPLGVLSRRPKQHSLPHNLSRAPPENA